MSSNFRPSRAATLAVASLMTGGFLLPGSAQAVTIDVNSTPIVFANGAGDPDIGVQAPIGFSHRYDNVITVGGVSVDARVTVVSMTGIDSDDIHANGANNLLDNLDANGSGGESIKVDLDVFGLDNQGGDTNFQGEAVIRVAFLQDGTENAATLQNVLINVKDIDSRQFVEFPAISSYLLTNPTDLNVATNTSHPNLVLAGSTRFFEPRGSSSLSSDEMHWAQVAFSQLSSIDIKLGARESGSASLNLGFSAAGFTTATTNTVFTVDYNNNGSTTCRARSVTGNGPITASGGPSRPGFTFTGWNTELNGSGISVPAGSSLTPTANTTLFAQWTANSLAAITFANGSGDPDIGVNAPIGFSHRYNNAVTVNGVSADALVSVINMTGIDSDDNHANGADNRLDILDEKGCSGDAINLSLDIFGLDGESANPIFNGEVVIRVAFLQSGTQNAATLQNVLINVKDIDSRQFVEFPAISSYLLSSSTDLSVATNTSHASLVPEGSTRFFEPTGSASLVSDEEHWAEVSYDQLSFIDIKLGARESGTAFFGIDFSAANFVTTTNNVNVPATNFTISYNNNGSNDTTPSPVTGSAAVTVANAPSRSGFIFTGWNTEMDGTGIGIAATSSLIPSANITLFAQWSAIAPTTTVAPGSTIAPASPVAPTAQASTPPKAATRQESLPATGANSFYLILALMGISMVGFGWASRASRRAAR